MQIVPLKERSAAGRFTVVDDSDFEWVSRRSWPYRLRPRGRATSRWVMGYAGSCGDTLHRALIIEALGSIPANKAIVHQSGWGLDNRRMNLIVASLGWHKNRPNIHRHKQCWQVQLGQKVVGRFDTEAEAVIAHEEAALAAGYLTPRMQAELLLPVIDQLDAWVLEGRLIRHIQNAPLIEDRYRLNLKTKTPAAL